MALGSICNPRRSVLRLDNNNSAAKTHAEYPCHFALSRTWSHGDRWSYRAANGRSWRFRAHPTQHADAVSTQRSHSNGGKTTDSANALHDVRAERTALGDKPYKKVGKSIFYYHVPGV